MMKNLREYCVNEQFVCEGWVESVYNEQRNSLKVDIKMKLHEGSDNLVSFVNGNHPLFNYLMQTGQRFYARVQGIVTGTYNEMYHSLKVNITAIEPTTYIEAQVINGNGLIDQLKAHLRGFQDKELYNLCCGVLKDESFRIQVFNAPSHKEQAYCYRGGLLQHIIRLMDLIDVLVKPLQQNHFLEYQTYEMNKDLLKTIALFHDLGVAKALYIDEFGAINYTLEGELVGSSTMSVEILTEMLMKYPLSNEYLKMNLRSIVASSKADVEEQTLNHSKTMPKTKEAVFFANLERLEFQDARFQSLEREYTQPEMVKGFGKLFVVPNLQPNHEQTHIESSNLTEEAIDFDLVEPLQQLEQEIVENVSVEQEVLEIDPMKDVEPTNQTPINESENHPFTQEENISSDTYSIFVEETEGNVIVSFMPMETELLVEEFPMQNELFTEEVSVEMNPFVEEVEMGLNPYENSLSLDNLSNPYANPFETEGGVVIEDIYSMSYEEGQPLDIPTKFPETPTTRPNVK